MNWFAILLGKLLSAILRLTGRQGAALPGLVIERLHPKFLPHMLDKLPQGVVVVTGTNGKTTTTKMLAQLLHEDGLRVLTNKTGGNFVRGIIGTIVQSASWTGRLPYDIAVIELDEAYAARFVAVYQPKVSVLLNVMRDQLDRFGEIDTTARLLAQVAAATTEQVIVNDDDPRLRQLPIADSAQMQRFGVSKRLAEHFPTDDSLYGAQKTGVDRAERVVELVDIVDNKTTYSVKGQKLTTSLHVDGPHNAQNAAAALAALLVIRPDIAPATLPQMLSELRPAFGRGEVLQIAGRTLVLQLVKNPAGFRQALHVLDTHRPDAIAIIINDDYADGRDVSWLWDVEFTGLQSHAAVYTGGTRGYDMANRLKYDEVTVSAVELALPKTLATLLAATHDGQTVVVFATYTAMLKFRRLLKKHGKVVRV